MFDLAKAFDATYNPESGLYIRKDVLFSIVPESMQGMRKEISLLVKKYNAKLVVKILTEGYPECPCCGRKITKPNMSGNYRDEFIKTCGRKSCLQWYLSQGSDYGKALQKKAKVGFRKRIQPYMEIAEEKDFGFVIRCTRCGRKRKRNASNASAHCNCSKGQKSSDTRASNNAEEKAARLKELRSYLPKSTRITKVYHNQCKVDLHCSTCNTTQTKWLGAAINWRCGCGKQDRLQGHYESVRANTLVKVKKHLRSIGLKYLGPSENGRYLVRCKCGKEFVPNQVQMLTYGCKSCSVKATAPARMKTSRKTCLKRYGVEYSSQDPAVQEKMVNSGYRAKAYTLGDRTVNVRGYEPQALDYLIAKGIDVQHIRAGGPGIPSIPYVYQGKNRLYFPDILLRAPGKRDMIIEVKSTWTIKLDLPKILAKKRAVEKAGYTFRFMFMTADGQRLNTKKVLRECRKSLKKKSLPSQG